MIQVSIPLKIVSEANIREHWTKSHKRRKSQKQIVRAVLSSHKIPTTLPVTITMIRKGKKNLDSDNLQTAFKYIRDAISEHFFPMKKPGHADDHPLFTWVYAQEISKTYDISIVFAW
jgi:hypothetical protein